ncbi:MAG: hypothetical protein WD872_09905 [Pirellulaceae bacterium]
MSDLPAATVPRDLRRFSRILLWQFEVLSLVGECASEQEVNDIIGQHLAVRSLVNLYYSEPETEREFARLGEFFTAGYLRMCQASQAIRPARVGNVAAESFHHAATGLLKVQKACLWKLIDPGRYIDKEISATVESPFVDEKQLAEAWQEKADLLPSWGLSLEPLDGDSIIMIRLELVESLLGWDRLPHDGESELRPHHYDHLQEVARDGNEAEVTEEPPSVYTGIRSGGVRSVISCFRRGMTDRQEIASEAGCGVAYVSTIKSRYPDLCKPSE